MTPRMLGNVSLEIQGTTKKRLMMQALKSSIARSEKLTGRLYIGWPVGVEATLISAQGQVTAIDLSSSTNDPDYRERQDRAWNAVHRLMLLEPALMRGRTPKVDVKTLTIGHGIRAAAPDNDEYPLVSIPGAARKLEEFQADPPEDVDPEDVVRALLFIPVPTA